MQPIQNEEELQLTAEGLGGSKAPPFNKAVMDCEDENAVDTSHFFNVTLELGKGWMGTGAALIVLAIMLALVKEEEGGLSVLNAVGIPPNGAPLSARENEQENECQELPKKDVLTEELIINKNEDHQELETWKKMSQHGGLV